jgi:hypothetical protein
MEKRNYTRARKEANQRWNEAHKEQHRYYVAKSTAKRFINKLANHEDLLELKKLIEDKLK